MKRVLLLLLFLLPLTALADGMFYPPVAMPAKVSIPDQQALIHFTNGTERLVIETRFTGSGTNFAWVIPLPSQPVIEEATTGLFPTLQYLFRPQIIHDVPHYYVGILIALGIIYLIRLAVKSVKSVRSAFVIGFVLGVLAIILTALLLPALATTRSRGMASISSAQAVSILDRKIVGIFETTTISSHDPKALQTWLRDNGFAVSTNSEPVIASYVKDGWVFVAAKVRRDEAKLGISTPHPLSFTFKTDKPVYPMRLTGVDNGPLSVELYVFGPARAEAPHFKVERCTRPNYPELPSGGVFPRHSWLPEPPDIVHPLLRKWVGGSPVVTKLVGTLTPEQMRQDVQLSWTSFTERRSRLFSRVGALTEALNWGTGVFAAGLCLAFVFTWRNKNRERLLQLVGVAVTLGIFLIGTIYLALPKTEVRMVKDPRGKMAMANMVLRDLFLDVNPMKIANLRSEANYYLNTQTNDVKWAAWARNWHFKNWDDNFLGGRIHEEDSPGNYILRETNGRLELVGYDDAGAELVLVLGNQNK